jgi:hypothetical protein
MNDKAATKGKDKLENPSGKKETTENRKKLSNQSN